MVDRFPEPLLLLGEKPDFGSEYVGAQTRISDGNRQRLLEIASDARAVSFDAARDDSHSSFGHQHLTDMKMHAPYRVDRRQHHDPRAIADDFEFTDFRKKLVDPSFQRRRVRLGE